MVHSDDIEGLRQLHDTEEKKETWKDYAKLNREMDKEMAHLRQHTFDGTITEHNLSLKMKYDLDKYFKNGVYDTSSFYLLRNTVFYLAVWLGVALLMGIGSNEL
jgi:hypothetical protein